VFEAFDSQIPILGFKILSKFITRKWQHCNPYMAESRIQASLKKRPDEHTLIRASVMTTKAVSGLSKHDPPRVRRMAKSAHDFRVE